MIKKRNLDPSLVQWIMTQTGLGPGIGDIKYVVPAASSSSQFRTWLQQMGVSDGDIHLLPSDAYTEMEAGRNDVMLVMPGVYAETAALAWSKDWTHLLGLGGPNVGGDYSLAGVCINTVTTEVAETITITGDRCIFKDVMVSNAGNHASNTSAVRLNGWGCTFDNVVFQGIMTANQAADVDCCSLSIDYLGHFPLFRNCVIGQNQWGTAGGRSGENQGHLRFVGATFPAPVNGRFYDCQFLSWAETDTCVAIAVPSVAQPIDRVWLFDGCSFSNHWPNYVDDLTKVINDDYAGTHVIQLKRCTADGFTNWGGRSGGLETDMPITGTGGGLSKYPSGASGS